MFVWDCAGRQKFLRRAQKMATLFVGSPFFVLERGLSLAAVQRLIDVGDQIVTMFDANGESDQVRRDP